MSSINPLGRTFNATASITSSNKRVSLRDASGVGFFVLNASGATSLVVAEANASTGGTSQTLAGTFPYWTQGTGTGVWVAGAGGVNGTSITTNAQTGALLFCFIPQGALSDGFSYLSASHATGAILYVLADLDVQRKPTNLRDVIA